MSEFNLDEKIFFNDNKIFEIISYTLNASNNDIYTPHTHHFLEISLIKQGHGTYLIDDKVYVAKPGDVFILNNQEKHLLTVESDIPLVNVVIHFEPRFIWSNDEFLFDSKYLNIFYNRSLDFENVITHNTTLVGQINDLFEDIENEFMKKYAEYELIVKAKFLNILALLVRHYGNANASLPYNQKEKVIIQKVINFIDLNYNKSVTLDDIAKIAHMNPSYFSTFFKKYNGVSPSKYITQKRIHYAKELIKTSDKSMLEIALLCGFNNSTNFNICFKKATGFTPSQYKHTHS